MEDKTYDPMMRVRAILAELSHADRKLVRIGDRSKGELITESADVASKINRIAERLAKEHG
jgi:hypothetical protein